MSKVKYRYNPETLSYDKIETGFRFYLSRVFTFSFFGALMGLVYFFAYVYLIDSPREIRLERENSRMLAQYEIMRDKLSQVQVVLDDIQQRDENVYRVIFQADSIPNSVRRAGFGGVNRYRYLEDLDNASLVVNTAQKLDVIMKQLYVQSKSFDEIIDLTQRKEEMLRCIPAIQPVSNRDLRRTASGFGWRIDPIYKTRRFHEGIDFSAPTGTEIYATGDGVITSVRNSAIGYGKHIEIDHGFGYSTLYAHLDEFNVRVGQRVNRGDVIGFVGNTGKSTAPHLHYEVRIKGRAVDPTHYFFQDLTPEQYEEMIRIASNSNRTFD
ncbi:M23 family metallopeptidase [Alkalitalea saponilacus]|uniref:Murein DD-endopeptidase MepM and murein hydrolase activator NlpD, contain LysM domain n=1 Tax=Alkalitalea saponilacus TaxID=889453 RepID=A0A1T5BNG4_9BACT|nr:M23 family metallopeptidase [Alkalitalea saponilacus]ASB49643.1 peptidase M23 [Alkalitalea saponilacus]SKB48738.1 Murein DD-endopeptidase MepM and murein hydrolase activator NlpD, contain LysM domain [Alkalitalea saponilacus]